MKRDFNFEKNEAVSIKFKPKPIRVCADALCQANLIAFVGRQTL